MNFKLTATKKTYYIVGGCSAALALAGAALYLPGYYFDFLFTLSAILAGAMFLLVAAAEGTKTPEGKAALVALLLQLVYFFPGVPQKVGGALAWPVFAAAHFMAAEKEGAFSASAVQLACRARKAQHGKRGISPRPARI